MAPYHFYDFQQSNLITFFLNSFSVVFCIHGNKFGVAHCCDDLWPTSDNDAHTDDDKSPLVEASDEQRKQHRHASQDAGKVLPMSTKKYITSFSRS